MINSKEIATINQSFLVKFFNNFNISFSFHLNFCLIAEVRTYLLSSFLEFNIKISLNKSNIDESKLAI